MKKSGMDSNSIGMIPVGMAHVKENPFRWTLTKTILREYIYPLTLTGPYNHIIYYNYIMYYTFTHQVLN